MTVQDCLELPESKPYTPKIDAEVDDEGGARDQDADGVPVEIDADGKDQIEEDRRPLDERPKAGSHGGLESAPVVRHDMKKQQEDPMLDYMLRWGPFG